MKRSIVIVGLVLSATAVPAQSDTLRTTTLEAVSIQSKSEGIKRMAGAVNGSEIGQDELFRAACCNLGESFVANPAVDVNYSDAAAGARQIKLLGLSGTYVQMLTEGLPMRGGAAQPYLLGYVPGAWMRSISVSKGASSVKNGPQSITGQIDVEYLKPDEDQGLLLNLYGDSHRKGEGNLVGNVHLNRYLSTEVVAHWEKDFMHHDENGDGWIDLPSVEQLHVQNRWKYRRGRYIMHAGIGYLDEERHGGQHEADALANPYRIHLHGRGLEGYMKHAYLLDKEHNTNLAFMGTVNTYALDGHFGTKMYSDEQQGLSAQLLLEHDFSEAHQLSTGLGLTGDRIGESYTLLPAYDGSPVSEWTPGVYAQYTYKPSYRFTAMAGLRADMSSLYGTYVTPRIHIKWMAADWVTLRFSTGKGYRSPHALAENHYLLASGRTLTVDAGLPQEEAWNSGVSAAFYIPTGERTVTLNAEYYYTDFLQQVVVDYDSDPAALHLAALQGASYSHTLQVDASYDLTDDLGATVAFRYNDVRCTYGSVLMEKPLQSRYKGLVTLSWKPLMALWHVDLTLQFNGPGRIPAYYDGDGTLVSGSRFAAYPQLNLQLTREFRHVTLYVGGENLTNNRQPMPVVDAANPWSATFDPTLVWGPVRGIMGYMGVRMNFWRL